MTHTPDSENATDGDEPSQSPEATPQTPELTIEKKLWWEEDGIFTIGNLREQLTWRKKNGRGWGGFFETTSGVLFESLVDRIAQLSGDKWRERYEESPVAVLDGWLFENIGRHLTEIGNHPLEFLHDLIKAVVVHGKRGREAWSLAMAEYIRDESEVIEGKPMLGGDSESTGTATENTNTVERLDISNRSDDPTAWSDWMFPKRLKYLFGIESSQGWTAFANKYRTRGLIVNHPQSGSKSVSVHRSVFAERGICMPDKTI